MRDTRWAKIRADVWSGRGRALLLVLAIAIGTFAITAVATGYTVLSRETAAGYAGSEPAAATLRLTPTTDVTAAVPAVRGVDGVADAQARGTHGARAQVGGSDQLAPAIMFVVPAEVLRIGLVTPPERLAALGTGQILLERASASVLGNPPPGSTVQVTDADGLLAALQMAGTVFDAGQAPGATDGIAYGYITEATATTLGYPGPLNEIRLAVTDPNADADAITVVAARSAAALPGGAVTGIDVPPPGEHPHQRQMTALFVLLGVFGVLTCGLTGILVYSSVIASLARETRQVAVLKVLGASRRAIAGIYGGQVLLLAALAVAVAVPTGITLGLVGAAWGAEELNFDLTTRAVPAWAVLLPALIGLAVPLASAARPIRKAAASTVRHALDDHGVTDPPTGTTPRWTAHLDSITAAAIRNTARRRARTALTVLMLAAGGALVLSAANVGAAWTATLDQKFAGPVPDITVALELDTDPNRRTRVLDAARSTPGVAAVQDVTTVEAALAGDDGPATSETYPGGVHGGITLTGATVDDPARAAAVTTGRWLRPDDTSVVIITNGLLREHPEYGLGATLRPVLTLDGQPTPRSAMRIVGVIDDLTAASTLYLPEQQLAELTAGAAGTRLMITVEPTAATTTERVAADVDTAVTLAGATVDTVQTATGLRATFDRHIVILLTALSMIALLVAAVGALGLSSTMAVAVLERTRELGVLAVIGATPRTVARLVITEGVLIGLGSAVLAAPLAIPLSALLGTIAGQVGLGTPLSPAISPLALFGWPATVSVVAAAATWLPARRASRHTPSEALAHT